MILCEERKEVVIVKRKKLAGKMLSILLACALVFTSLDTPVFAAEVTDISAEDSILAEGAQAEEVETALAGETDSSNGQIAKKERIYPKTQMLPIIRISQKRQMQREKQM